MARVYLDEDVSVSLKTLLEARGVQASSARDLGMLGKSDEEQLRKAVELGCVFLTHNRGDFERLYRDCLERNTHHFGIVILMRRRDVYIIAQKLTHFLAQHEDIENQLWYV